MDAFTIWAVWLGAMAGGGLTMVGLVETLRGRVVLAPMGINWTSTEVRLLGLTHLISGLCCGIYVLVFGLSLGARVIPQFWVGHPWGLFVSMPVAVVVLGGLFVQTVVIARHKEAWQSNRGGRTEE